MSTSPESVKTLFQVVSQLNDRFKSSFTATKKLHSSTAQTLVSQHQELNADKMLYNHAIDMVRVYWLLGTSAAFTCYSISILSFYFTVSSCGFGRVVWESGGL